MTFGDDFHLGRRRAKVRDGANKGLRTAAEHLLTEARAHTPIEEGTLERSGKVSTEPAHLQAAVSFDAPYAVRQHEDLSFRHDPGRSAKFLEKPMHTEAATIKQIVATAIRRELGT